MQRIDRFHFCRLVGREKSEDDSDQEAETYGDQYYINVHRKSHIHSRDHKADHLENYPGEEDTDQTSDHAEHNRFHQELFQDHSPVSTDGLPDTDLSGSLRHGNQHDIHNTDSSDDKGDSRYTAQKNREQ